MTKIATSIEQSKILKGMLPLESADMGWYYSKDPYAARNQMWLGTKVENADLPAWSLAALLEILPEPILTQFSEDKWNVAIFDKDNHFKEECFADNPIDCCYEMILKLHEQKLL